MDYCPSCGITVKVGEPECPLCHFKFVRCTRCGSVLPSPLPLACPTCAEPIQPDGSSATYRPYSYPAPSAGNPQMAYNTAGSPNSPPQQSFMDDASNYFGGQTEHQGSKGAGICNAILFGLLGAQFGNYFFGTMGAVIAAILFAGVGYVIGYFSHIVCY